MYKPSNGKKKKNKGKTFGQKLVSVILVLLVIAVVAGIGVGLYVFREIGGGARSSETKLVTIPEGASTATVADVLEENGIIGNTYVFRIYSRLTDADGTFQQGDHEIDPSLGYEAVITELQKTTYVYVPTFTVTFPEGTTCLAMAHRFEDLGVCTVDEFIDSCNNDFFDAPYYNDIGNDKDKFIKLEGFLFPDTYDFPEGSSIHEIIQIMLDNFTDKVYTPELVAKVEKSGLTLEETVILASIVEKEAYGEESYPKVAGVFINRLNNSDDFPCLESCTSTEHLNGNFIYGVLGYYYNGDSESRIRHIPDNLVEAYDTYTHEGLIVGAICNPGYLAIYSTVDYEDHDYYFFVTDCDKNFYWGKTSSEHDANIRKMNEYNAEHEG